MKRIGNITYELTEEEYNEIKNYLNDLNWAIGYENISDATELTAKLIDLFENN